MTHRTTWRDCEIQARALAEQLGVPYAATYSEGVDGSLILIEEAGVKRLRQLRGPTHEGEGWGVRDIGLGNLTKRELYVQLYAMRTALWERERIERERVEASS